MPPLPPPSLLCSLHTTMLINTQTAQNSFTDSLWHFVKIFASQEIKLFPNCIIIFACRPELRGRKRIKSAINQSINAALLRALGSITFLISKLNLAFYWDFAAPLKLWIWHDNMKQNWNNVLCWFVLSQKQKIIPINDIVFDCWNKVWTCCSVFCLALSRRR